MFKFIYLKLILCLSVVVCSYDYLDDTNDDNYFFEASGDDDYDYISLNTRIVGGAAADINDFPYQVSLQTNGIAGTYSFCGGSLISLRHVLTAAHCVYMKNSAQVTTLMKSTDFWVLAGTADSRNTNPQGQIRYVQQTFYHEKYLNMDNDIAVLKLTRPFDQQISIQPVKMKIESSPANLSCVVSGWGTLSSNGEIPRYLMEVDVPIVDHDLCGIMYSGIKITDNMICAGYKEGMKDSCQGDSGGPLRCENLLTGVVSFGIGCADKRYPGVYTEVAKYIPWISDRTSEKYCDYTDVNTMQYIENESPGENLIVPYQAIMTRLHLGKYIPFCVGTIVSLKHIVTSAHCMFIPENDGKFTKLNYGDIRIITGDGESKNVDKITVHEKYSNIIRRNDLAILQIKDEFIKSSKLSPIALRTLPVSNNNSCSVVGIATINNTCNISENTKIVDAITTDFESCKKSYINDIYVLDNKMCANIADPICEGDAIGILVCSNELSGIYSFSFGCGDVNYPGVYTEVFHYTDWIKNNMSGSGRGIFHLCLKSLLHIHFLGYLITYLLMSYNLR